MTYREFFRAAREVTAAYLADRVCPAHPNVLMCLTAAGRYCPVCRALERAKAKEPIGCRFVVAWVGPCGEPITDRGMCKKHAPLKCAGCGEPATQECPSASSLVCGAPICDQCRHGASGQHCRPGTEGTP